MINTYCDLLKKWNKSINLVQKNTTKDMLNRHIADSQQICSLLSKTDRVIDIGSGAGLPGVILAINGFSNVTLCEKNIKKITFLRLIKQKLGLQFEIDENIYNFKSDGHIAVSRAFGSLLKLCDIMTKTGVAIGFFHKGETYIDEINEAKREYEFEYNITPSITNNKSAIVQIFNVRRTMWEK